MDPTKLEIIKKYKTTGAIKACVYDESGHDCTFTDKVDLQSGTVLTYIGPDGDPNGGYVFKADGNMYCLHDDDLKKIEEV